MFSKSMTPINDVWYSSKYTVVAPIMSHAFKIYDPKQCCITFFKLHSSGNNIWQLYDTFDHMFGGPYRYLLPPDQGCIHELGDLLKRCCKWWWVAWTTHATPGSNTVFNFIPLYSVYVWALSIPIYFNSILIPFCCNHPPLLHHNVL